MPATMHHEHVPREREEHTRPDLRPEALPDQEMRERAERRRAELHERSLRSQAEEVRINYDNILMRLELAKRELRGLEGAYGIATGVFANRRQMFAEPLGRSGRSGSAPPSSQIGLIDIATYSKKARFMQGFYRFPLIGNGINVIFDIIRFIPGGKWFVDKLDEWTGLPTTVNQYASTPVFGGLGKLYSTDETNQFPWISVKWKAVKEIAAARWAEVQHRLEYLQHKKQELEGDYERLNGELYDLLPLPSSPQQYIGVPLPEEPRISPESIYDEKSRRQRLGELRDDARRIEDLRSHLPRPMVDVSKMRREQRIAGGFGRR